MWFLQKLRCRPQMDSSEQQHPDSQFQSIDNDNKLVQLLAQDLENLVLSCNEEVTDRSIQKQSVAIEENQVNQAVDEDLRQLIVKEAAGQEKVLEEDLKECRVSDVREAGESEIVCENQEEEVDDGDNDSGEVCEVKDEDLKEKNEIEIEDGDVSSGIGDNEDKGENVEDQRGNVGEEGAESVPGGGKLNYPLRLDAEDCAYYMRTGMCKFGSSCKFNHPLRRKNQQAAKETKKQKEENVEKRGQTDSKPTKETKKQKEEGVERRGQIDCKAAKETKKQKEENAEKRGQTDSKPTKEAKKQKEEGVERRGQIDCKYHTSSAGCKYGKACKYNHGRGKSVKTPVLEYNFVGLPIRPGEKECPYYMRNGSCKYGPSCRFNHPDPTAVGDGDAPTSYGNDGPLPLRPPSQPSIPNMPSWSAPRVPDPTTAFVPMMYPPTQSMPPPHPDWNGYQASAPVPAHLYPSSEQGLPIPPAFFLNNRTSDTNMYTHHQPPSDTNMYAHHQPPMVVSGYPERPGQPECSYYMKTGDCKYRASCKFHHPPNRSTRT